MKKLFLLAILLALPGFLFAETVMLYTRMTPVENEKGANIDRFIAVEDGVEDQFYNSGHIIFDAGIPKQAAAIEGSVNHTAAWAQQVALDGGAAYLLLVNLSFPSDDKAATVPTAVSYSFADVKSGAVIAQGTVSVDFTANDLKTKKPYDLCFLLGQEIAQSAMGKWQHSS